MYFTATYTMISAYAEVARAPNLRHKNIVFFQYLWKWILCITVLIRTFLLVALHLYINVKVSIVKPAAPTENHSYAIA